MIKKNNSKCRICFGEFKPDIIIGRELWSFSDKRFEYLECASCGCIQLKEYPTDIGEYYSDKYYSFNVNRSMPKYYRRLINMRDNYALTGSGIIGRILFSIMPTTIFKNIPYPVVKRDSKILDVGCGDGSFIHNLHKLGFVNLTGIDPYLIKEYELNGELTIKRADIYDVSEIFDCIILKGTLEHQPNQLMLLQKIRSLLSQDGLVVIRIPVVDSHAWERYRENWVQFDAPRHFYLHTVKSIEILARQANLKVIDIKYDSGIFQFVGSEQILAGIALHDPVSYLVNRNKSIFTRRQIKDFTKKAKILDEQQRGDVVIFILKKD
jgi:SAM-dependent methyltransferase